MQQEAVLSRENTEKIRELGPTVQHVQISEKHGELQVSPHEVYVGPGDCVRWDLQNIDDKVTLAFTVGPFQKKEHIVCPTTGLTMTVADEAQGRYDYTVSLGTQSIDPTIIVDPIPFCPKVPTKEGRNS